MFILQNISYIHADGELLFNNVNLSIANREKIAIIGNNGVGKSTLLRIIAGQLHCSNGSVTISSVPYYVPQIIGQFDDLTVAQAIGIDEKLNALSEILSGNVSDENLSVLSDDWMIEERCNEALDYWELGRYALTTKMKTLSGGQKTKVFLAGIKIRNPEIVLLDEPTNHLDLNARELLYRFVSETSCTIAVVSHDRTLLNKLDKMCELNMRGIKIYGGNYDFYSEHKTIEHEALICNFEEKQKSLRKAKQVEQENIERQQKRESQGKKNTAKGGLPPILAGKRKNNAENSTAHLKGVHADKINLISQELNDLQSQIPDSDKMKFDFDNSKLHSGKILVNIKNVNFKYNEKSLWNKNLDFQIISGERIAIKGKNGSGKTTLLKLILGNLQPDTGEIYRSENKSVYIDQDYSLINNDLSVYQQSQIFNDKALQEHEVKIRLNRFLFSKDFWNKPCSVLSGGEKMRLLLCCLTIAQHSPDIIVLDEPTNNIDIQSVEVLSTAINDYQGTLIVVSHDLYFLEQIKVERVIDLKI
jgi:ATPase subunit of ABC transporter with duplicated ATPase domains